ncbi:coagulation factor VII-like isoform X2 [Pogoniulus pusillus]|uniref:coagulation factor VII-like isoform X2 n=1 Tax=Pogoniulus pusillus TaxID=488313 RepID=UPI0030B94BFC
MLTKMESSSSPVVLLLLLCSINSSCPFSSSVLMRKDEAHEVLKVHKRANYFLEEIRPGNLERECNEEKCSFEEAKEIFHAQEKTMEFWFIYQGLNPCSTNPCMNGGVCKIRHYNYFCICPPRFGGANCEKAPFPCGLIKARQALEEGWLGQKQLLRGLPQPGDDVTKWHESTIRQTEPEESAVGENETLKHASGQSMHMEGDATQTEVAGDASSWKETRVESVTQQLSRDDAAEPEVHVPEEHSEGLEGTTESGQPAWSEPTQGPAWLNKAPATAPGQKDMVGNAADQNRTGESAEQKAAGTSQAAADGGNHGSDWGNASDTPQPAQADLGAPLENSDSRITGGTLCHRGHCPWQVLIRNSKDVGFCGGSLISSRWVVTAAHCLDLVRPHHVTVGDFDKYQREFKEQKINVAQSWTHPHYDSNDYNSDIALLYLSSSVIVNEYAIPICLPSPSLATLLSEEGRVGMVSGWGATHDRGSTLRFLMQVRLPIVSLETCQQAMERLVTDNMFCAGHTTEVADACKGDSGGPFTVPYHNTWFLLGIVSWGEGCAEKGKYGVYTRVANYIPWIKEVVESVADSENFTIHFS